MIKPLIKAFHSDIELNNSITVFIDNRLNQKAYKSRLFPKTIFSFAPRNSTYKMNS